MSPSSFQGSRGGQTECSGCCLQTRQVQNRVQPPQCTGGKEIRPTSSRTHFSLHTGKTGQSPRAKAAAASVQPLVVFFKWPSLELERSLYR